MLEGENAYPARPRKSFASSVLSFNASAILKSWEDSNGMILSSTSATSSEVYANGTVMNKGSEAKYQVVTSLFFKSTGNSAIGSRPGSWSRNTTLKKGQSIKANNVKSYYARKSNYLYSARTLVMRNNQYYGPKDDGYAVDSPYAKI